MSTAPDRTARAKEPGGGRPSDAATRKARHRPRAPRRRSAQVFLFFSIAILLTGIGSLLFADLLWRSGWSSSRAVLLALFAILFLLASIGCVHGIYGFFLLRSGRERQMTQFGDYRQRSLDEANTALVFTIFNEDVRRVLAGLRAVHQSLAATGELERFDFFIISDSNEPDKWIEEEQRWFALARDLGALGRIHYRRRLVSEGKKSGNVRDFLRAWGRRYRYFIVLDADSTMSGSTIVDLVRIMETNPGVGLLQTAPRLVNARSAFGRAQQFANRLYGPIFAAGLNYWSREAGNYWGHNAIIRVEPFMNFCDLPQLPGRKPFGGQILSHDFVEAALLRREGWEVWLAPELDGSYEEGPPGIIENAQRDRRWCQGNLQHFLVLFARGLHGNSRIHLLFGILGYLAGPLWLAFLVVSTWILWYRENTGLSEIVVGAFTPMITLSQTGHALLIFGMVMTVLFLPKVLSLVDLALDPPRRRAFGGIGSALAGAAAETVFSALHAPLQMLFHTKFVAATLAGTSVHWTAQRRGGDGTSWGAALRQHAGQTGLGLAWGALMWWLDPKSFWWFTPVLAGMVLSIPLSVITSRESLGQALRRAGLFLTPEETSSVPELDDLEREMAEPDTLHTLRFGTHLGLRQALVDPYANAIHVTMLEEKKANPQEAAGFAALGAGSEGVRRLGNRLLAEGPDALTADERLLVLSDPQLMLSLHREIWRRSPAELWTGWNLVLAKPGAYQ